MPIIIDLDEYFYLDVVKTVTGKKFIKHDTKIVKAIREVSKSNEWKSFINRLNGDYKKE